MKWIFLLLCIFFVSKFAFSVPSRCKGPKFQGGCPDNREPMWYFNEEKFECIAYAPEDCPSDRVPTKNFYESRKDCIDFCFPQATSGPCAGNGNPYDGPEVPMRPGTNCWEGPDRIDCPSGYKCNMGAFMAACCNSTNEQLYKDAYGNTCPNGEKAYQREPEYDQHFFGDSCRDLPCPEDYRCVQVNPRFSKCCLVPENEKSKTRKPQTRLPMLDIAKVRPLRPGPCREDFAEQCPKWAANGECKTSKYYMLTHCQKTCKCCGCTVSDILNAPYENKCADRSPFCIKWAEAGDCEDAGNPEYMRAFCRRSCRIC